MTGPSRMRGQVVELCGLPGSGKSHVLRLLVWELTRRGVTVHVGGDLIGPDIPAPARVGRKLWFTACEVVTRPPAAASVGLRVATSGQRERRDVAGRVVQWLSTQHLVRAARSLGGLHIVDEGVVQALWSIGLRGDVSGVLQRLQARQDWAAPDLVVVVEAPLEIVDARLAARPSRHSRVQQLPAPERRAEIAHGQRLLVEIVDWWTHTRGADSMLRWTGDAADTARVVGGAVEPLS